MFISSTSANHFKRLCVYGYVPWKTYYNQTLSLHPFVKSPQTLKKLFTFYIIDWNYGCMASKEEDKQNEAVDDLVRHAAPQHQVANDGQSPFQRWWGLNIYIG